MLLRRHCFYENRVFVSLVCCCALDNKPNGIKNRTQMVEPSLSFIRSDFFCYFQLHRKLIAVQNHFITVYIPVPFARAAATFAQPMHSRVLYKMQLQIVQTTFGRCGQNEYFSHTYENILFHLVAPTFISRSFFFLFHCILFRSIVWPSCKSHMISVGNILWCLIPSVTTVELKNHWGEREENKQTIEWHLCFDGKRTRKYSTLRATAGNRKTRENIEIKRMEKWRCDQIDTKNDLLHKTRRELTRRDDQMHSMIAEMNRIKWESNSSGWTETVERQTGKGDFRL